MLNFIDRLSERILLLILNY